MCRTDSKREVEKVKARVEQLAKVEGRLVTGLGQDVLEDLELLY